MTSRTRLIVLFVTAPVIAFVVIGGLLGKTMAQQESYLHLKVFEDVVSLISSNYVEEANMTKVMRGAMRGLAEGLDADSAYLPPEELKAYQSGEKAGAGETGIELTRTYYLRVIAVREGSPAARAGIRGGDYLRMIDGKPTREMSLYEGKRLLSGAPGTTVKLLVIRGSLVDPHVVDLTREVPSGPDVTGRLEGTTGVIRVATFDAGVARNLGAEIDKLAKAGATSLLVDVRDTATGGYESGIAAARLFVASGTLASKEMRGSAREPITAAAGDGRVSLRTALLVNDGTSGAAEIFAAALSGNNRATLVGERTRGRAAMQKLILLPDGSGMVVSNGWYLTPTGQAIHEKGLTPAVAVEAPDVEFGAAPPATDVVLQKGLETVRAK